jgi:hypothetical protein
MKRIIALILLIAGIGYGSYTNQVPDGMYYTDGTNDWSMSHGDIVSTNTGTKIQGYEVHGTAVVEAGLAGVNAGTLSVADQAAGFAWQNTTYSNGFPTLSSATATNYPLLLTTNDETVVTYSATEINNALRIILMPSHLGAQLPEASSPIVTAYAISGTESNVVGAASLVVTDSQDFTFDGGNLRFFYSKSGAVDVPFALVSSFSFSQNASAAEVTIRATKNGTALEGIFFLRTISNANTIGAATLTGHFTMSEGDYLQVSAESDKAGDFSFWSFQTDIVEEGQ